MVAAVLGLCPHWGVHAGASPEALRETHETLIHRARAALVAVRGEVVASDGEMLLAWVPEAAAALTAAFELLRLAGGTGTAGIGWGDVQVEPGRLFGAEAARVRRIAWRGPPGRVLCTEAFRAALRPVPAGVGVFRAGADQAHRVGFEVHEIADHRP